MTFSLLLSNVCDSISAISISGVTVKDVDQIAPTWISTPNVLYPNPNSEGFITGFGMEFDSIMQGTNAPITVNYTLNYRFLGTQIGDMANFSSAYADVVSKVALIVNAIISTPAPYSGRVQMSLGSVSVGAKIDPAGNKFHGADIQLNIQEMQN